MWRTMWRMKFKPAWELVTEESEKFRGQLDRPDDGEQQEDEEEAAVEVVRGERRQGKGRKIVVADVRKLINIKPNTI